MNSTASNAGAADGKLGGAADAQTIATPITIKSLLEAGAHFGHQTQRWNPKMLPYIYCERNDVHIINLDITLKLWNRARKYIVDTLARGGNLLVVGTKPQAKEIIERESQRSGAFYVTSRWLGGTLTNFQTIKNSIDRMRKLEDYLQRSELPDTKIRLHKREKLEINRQIGKLDASLGGIRQMKRPPEVLFVVDVVKEAIAVSEARRLHIPVIALTDTNTDPNLVDFPIPSNDDAARTIQLFLGGVADAVIEGRSIYESRAPQGGDGGMGSGGEHRVDSRNKNGAHAAPATGSVAQEATV